MENKPRLHMGRICTGYFDKVSGTYKILNDKGELVGEYPPPTPEERQEFIEKYSKENPE